MCLTHSPFSYLSEEGKKMLELKKSAIAGTMESSDAMISIEPNGGQGIAVEIESSVKEIFGQAIETSIRDVLRKFDVRNGRVLVRDRGALDFTIRARMACAVCRAAEITYDWRDEDEQR